MKSYYRLPLRVARWGGRPHTEILDANGSLVATVYPAPRTDGEMGWVEESIPAAEAFAKLIVESVNLTLRGETA